ncbi:tetraacyldisaccharide 4'-kinase [Pleionea sp. CnH1-48]|uniref:tetraacyldisaccharide 4'-kinase n=1 Tax=Pleionea sp. CnH1-48 TaxID=2954494 RepID=UPI00209799D9|nr:tetraacyldisaccharide 4'-kinase [Pleionea sp. CnH1-48]MCO7225853.1 tetraacyldisaccharide 4'-kinase [Pleionea sp. CnH1-48]
MSQKIENFWYSNSLWKWLLWPLHGLLWLLTMGRFYAYRQGWFKQYQSAKPVVVVGNISIGGTGKTPFIIWLVKQLQEQGISAAIISRGYGGKAESYPLTLSSDTRVEECGDEPFMMYQRLHIPIVVDPVRSRACQYVEQHFDVDVIISDDGLQHYALARQVEIVMIDGFRHLGNRLLLPFGPLREPAARLKSASLVLMNSGEPRADVNQLSIAPVALVNMVSGERCTIEQLPFQECYGVCGIGNPKKFEHTLNQLPITFSMKTFADHHHFEAQDFADLTDQPIIMTEKDAEKCRAYAQDDWWYLEIDLVPNEQARVVIEHWLQEIKKRVGL